MSQIGASIIVPTRIASSAQAQPVVGVPHDWQVSFPPAYTPLMEKVIRKQLGL